MGVLIDHEWACTDVNMSVDERRIVGPLGVLVTKGMWFAHSEMFVLQVLNPNMVILRTPSLLHYSHQVY